ncbi:DUF4190 domain-containing protein [Jiangella ureilytica]|uniref:DUF4190 domain-containing protein n=1 Tax=Jiangella ureilytica TaxID=2530374 RepID=A0A4R4RW12_9ACTN|nr:DUF4190 domain-containing protein [Jiangella ureilytica]TDC53579.1 DUF4190 domain-containing protein [Jiangella ureilytica]
MSEPGAPPPTPEPYAQPSPRQPGPYQPQQPGPYEQYPQASGPYLPYPPYPGGTGPYPLYGPYPWSAAPAPRKPGTNGLAVAALVLGIVAIFPLAIVFGIIALVQTSRTGQSGRGLAVGGLVAAGFWLVVIVGSVVYVVVTSAERNADGEITEEGTVSTMDIEVGDCLNGLRGIEDDTLTTLPAVPCDQPHEGEVYATFELEDGDYPGVDGIAAVADERCANELAALSQEAWNDPDIGLFYFYPDELYWPNDREVVCIAHAIEGNLTVRLLSRPGV